MKGLRRAGRLLLLSLAFVAPVAERAMANDAIVFTNPTAADFIRALTPPSARGDAQADETAIPGETPHEPPAPDPNAGSVKIHLQSLDRDGGADPDGAAIGH